MIQAILFDIDGVLVDSVKANAQVYRDVLGHFGFTGPTDEEQAQHNHIAFIDNIRIYAPTASHEQVQQMFDYGTSQMWDYSQLILMEGVQQILGEMKKDYVLGVASSRLHTGIGSMLKHFGLDTYFSIQVGYEDTVLHKPDPSPLLFAAKKLGLKPEEIIYVGDAATDVQAANAAGMKMILYSHTPLAGANATVKSFFDVAHAVRDLSK